MQETILDVFKLDDQHAYVGKLHDAGNHNDQINT